MGYGIRAEYTLKLIKNQKANNFIDAQYFATGFLLSNDVNEQSLISILKNWKEIDLITSNRIRFLFFIDNETSIGGYPQKPYFTEHGYKRYNEKLYKYARESGFEINVKAGYQKGSWEKDNDWYPEAKVQKLAERLGVVKHLPCLIWSIYSETDFIFVLPLKSIDAHEILTSIKAFSTSFYDLNNCILSQIDVIEDKIEKKISSLKVTIKDLEIFSKYSYEIEKSKKLTGIISSFSFTDKNTNQILKDLNKYIHEILKLDITQQNTIFETIILNFKDWIKYANWISDKMRISFNENLPVSNKFHKKYMHLINYYFTLPDEIQKIYPKSFNDKSSIIDDFFKINFSGNKKIQELPIEKINEVEKRRNALFRKLLHSNSKNNEILFRIQFLLSISFIFTDIITHQYFDDELTNYFNRIKKSITNLYNDTISTISVSVKFWILYKIDDMFAKTKLHIQDIVDLSEQRHSIIQEISNELKTINELTKDIKFSTLTSYLKIKLQSELPADKENQINGLPSIYKEIDNAVTKYLIPVKYVIPLIDEAKNEVDEIFNTEKQINAQYFINSQINLSSMKIDNQTNIGSNVINTDIIAGEEFVMEFFKNNPSLKFDAEDEALLKAIGACEIDAQEKASVSDAIKENADENTETKKKTKNRSKIVNFLVDYAVPVLKVLGQAAIGIVLTKYGLNMADVGLLSE